ncbi:MAG: Nif3-like dinuclear metal center hexameric protein [Cellulomonadaceae bacterium]
MTTTPDLTTTDLGTVVGLLDERYPPRTAEPWDAVGLVVGDPAAPVRRVLFAVDPVATVVDEALAWGADLIVTHHPLLLEGVHSVAATSAKGALVHRMIRGGCALYVAHTNADAAHRGVADALAGVLGLTDLVPLVPGPDQELDKHVVFVPDADAVRLIDALSAAGAGAIGDYSRCAWSARGTGTFLPGAGAHPAVGLVHEVTTVAETRVEMVAPRRLRTRVVAAMRAAHPYEEPAFDVVELAELPGRTGLGRVGSLAPSLSLGALAQRVAERLPATAQGVRVSGPPDARVERVAVLGGSGGSLVDAVRACGADVYVTSDLRHHQVSELREQAEFSAAPGTPFVIDTAHFASEWPWLELAAHDLGHDCACAGATVETRVSTRCTDPWTARLPCTIPIDLGAESTDAPEKGPTP